MQILLNFFVAKVCLYCCVCVCVCVSSYMCFLKFIEAVSIINGFFLTATKEVVVHPASQEAKG